MSSPTRNHWSSKTYLNITKERWDIPHNLQNLLGFQFSFFNLLGPPLGPLGLNEPNGSQGTKRAPSCPMESQWGPEVSHGPWGLVGVTMGTHGSPWHIRTKENSPHPWSALIDTRSNLRLGYREHPACHAMEDCEHMYHQSIVHGPEIAKIASGLENHNVPGLVPSSLCNSYTYQGRNFRETLKLFVKYCINYTYT